MICEHAKKVRIGRLGKGLPDRVFISNVWVRITTTRCHLGGSRYWFLCPSCGRRCAILYPRKCRKCINGRYAVELLKPLDRKITKAIELRARLGQTVGGLLAPFPAKPKWTRWHTYLRLRAEGLKLEQEIWSAEHVILFGRAG